LVVSSQPADGVHALVEDLTKLAMGAQMSRLEPIIGHLRRPIEVAVIGRTGVGRATVAAALRERGVLVGPDDAAADVRVLVCAEALKPEEHALAATGPPTLIVLNKADLTGSRSVGALRTAKLRAAEVQALTGTPTVAMVGLLAVTTTLDGSLVDALRTLVTTPADLSSVDAFVRGDHPVGSETRALLLEQLDRFGTAHAVVALAGGTDPADLPALLQRLSNVDDALTRLEAVSAQVRYRRLRAALAEMRALAMQLDDERLFGLLNRDATVLTTMAAAVDVVEADGMRVDPGDHPDAHLRRAVHWRRYGCGPVDELHRSCSADITRGSLRLLHACR
jgi:hypothetical protein